LVIVLLPHLAVFNHRLKRGEPVHIGARISAALDPVGSHTGLKHLNPGFAVWAFHCNFSAGGGVIFSLGGVQPYLRQRA
jgi:hypothetical protein